MTEQNTEIADRKKSIIDALKADDYREKATDFSKEDLFASENKESILKKIVTEGLLVKAQEVLSAKGDPITKTDITAEDAEGRKGMMSQVQPQLNPLLAAVVYDRLDDVQTALEMNGEKLSKEDMTTKYHDKNAFHAVFMDGNKEFSPQEKLKKVERVCAVIRKDGKTVDKADLLVSNQWQESVLNSLVKNGSLDWAIDTIEKNGEHLTREDVASEEGSKMPTVERVLEEKQFDRLVENLEKNGEALKKEDIINEKSWGGRIARAIQSGQLADIDKHLRKHGESLNKKDFTGNYSVFSYSALVTVIETGQAETVQEICRKNGEKPFNLKDIPLADARIFRPETFEKALQIETGNVGGIKQYWKDFPADKKSEKLEKAYKKALRSSAADMLYSSKITSKSRD